MAFKDRVCCICNEHKRFLSRPNAGQKLYCIQCKAKITKEHGQDYWKPCSFEGFLEASSKSMEKKSDDKATFDHVSKYYDDGYYNEE